MFPQKLLSKSTNDLNIATFNNEIAVDIWSIKQN